MPPETLLLRKGLVFGSALVYWAGVFIQARRVRKRIGRSPNVRPRGSKERLLWLGWLFVIRGWIGQPFFLGGFHSRFFSLMPVLLHPVGLVLGIVLIVGGYAGTLWCYAALGDAWRIGIRKREKTALVNQGPYRFVRHPIYLFQTIMLGGVVLLCAHSISGCYSLESTSPASSSRPLMKRPISGTSMVLLIAIISRKQEGSYPDS